MTYLALEEWLSVSLKKTSRNWMDYIIGGPSVDLTFLTSHVASSCPHLDNN